MIGRKSSLLQFSFENTKSSIPSLRLTRDVGFRDAGFAMFLFRLVWLVLFLGMTWPSSCYSR